MYNQSNQHLAQLGWLIKKFRIILLALIVFFLEAFAKKLIKVTVIESAKQLGPTISYQLRSIQKQ